MTETTWDLDEAALQLKHACHTMYNVLGGAPLIPEQLRMRLNAAEREVNDIAKAIVQEANRLRNKEREDVSTFEIPVYCSGCGRKPAYHGHLIGCSRPEGVYGFAKEDMPELGRWLP